MSPPKPPIGTHPASAAAQLLRWKATELERSVTRIDPGKEMRAQLLSERAGMIPASRFDFSHAVPTAMALAELYRHQANSLEWLLALEAAQKRDRLVAAAFAVLVVLTFMGTLCPQT